MAVTPQDLIRLADAIRAHEAADQAYLTALQAARKHAEPSDAGLYQLPNGRILDFDPEGAPALHVVKKL